MTERNRALQQELETALDRLMSGAPLVTVQEDVDRELIPYIEAYSRLLELTASGPDPRFRAALRARFVEGAMSGPGGAAELAQKVAALVAGTFLLGSALNPALAEALVDSAEGTVGTELADLVE